LSAHHCRPALHSFPTRRSSDLDGTVLYTPRPDFAGVDSFTYRIRDNEGALSNVATVSIRILNPPNAWQNPVRPLDVNGDGLVTVDRKSTRLNSSHVKISYAVFC